MQFLKKRSTILLFLIVFIFNLPIVFNNNIYEDFSLFNFTYNISSDTLVKEVNLSEYSVGDTLYFYNIENDNYVLVNDKVFAISNLNGELLFSFKNKPNLVVSEKRVVGNSEVNNLFIKCFYKFISSNVYRFIFLILPFFIILVSVIYKFIGFIPYFNEVELPIKLNRDSSSNNVILNRVKLKPRLKN